MTISPPSNVKLTPEEPARVLSCGLDTVVLSIYVRWPDEHFLSKLGQIQMEAIANGKEATGKIELGKNVAPYLFTIRAFGKEGYAYLMSGEGIDWNVGAWTEPIQRPSIRCRFSSELLWQQGLQGCLNRVLDIIDRMGGELLSIKPSRIDPCLDLLLPATTWDQGLERCVVCRARHSARYPFADRPHGLQFGKGIIVARLYDKPMEIAEKSRKFWMYDVWGLDGVPEGSRIIRTEFQVAREALKQLGVRELYELEDELPAIWKNLTMKWLRVVQDQTKHHTQQDVAPWWDLVSDGYHGAQDATPAVRERAIAGDIAQMRRQLLGLVTSLAALENQDAVIRKDEVLDVGSHLSILAKQVQSAGWTDEEFTERVKRKQAKYRRPNQNYARGRGARQRSGLSFKRSPDTGPTS